MTIAKKLVIVLFSGALFLACNMDAQEKAEFYKKEADEQRVKAEQMETMAKRAQLEVEKSAKMAQEHAEKANEVARIAEMKAIEATKALEACKNGN